MNLQRQNTTARSKTNGVAQQSDEDTLPLPVITVVGMPPSPPNKEGEGSDVYLRQHGELIAYSSLPSLKRVKFLCKWAIIKSETIKEDDHLGMVQLLDDVASELSVIVEYFAQEPDLLKDPQVLR